MAASLQKSLREITLFAFFLGLFLLENTAQARVIVSIKPIHSLVAAVMEGVDVPILLIDDVGSPHGYSLKPSQVRSLSEADLVFWVGAGLEEFLAKPLGNLDSDVEVVSLIAAPGLTLYTYFEGEEHVEEHVAYPFRNYDPHIWLDPYNGALMIEAIGSILSAHDPTNAVLYEENARSVRKALLALTAELSRVLEPARDVPYMVFHGAYQYFTRRFDLQDVVAITANPTIELSAARMARIEKKLAERRVRCLFHEPQFTSKIIDGLYDDWRLRIGVIDPLGASLEPGPEMYFDLIRDMAFAMIDCLKGRL